VTEVRLGGFIREAPRGQLPETRKPGSMNKMNPAHETMDYTVKEAFGVIRSLGMRVKRSNGEWEIRCPRSPQFETYTYYTDDTMDAVRTAYEMARQHAKEVLEIG
jgi:hypothetical protein